MSSSPLLSSSVSHQGDLNTKLLVISYQIRDPMSAEDKWIETEMDFYGLLNNILCLETAVCPLVIYQYISYCFRKQKQICRSSYTSQF